MKQKLIGVILVSLLFPSLAFAQADLDGWIGTWTVTMVDGSTATWEITETTQTDTGAFKFAYGTVNPGTDDVTFMIMSARFFPGQHYVEHEHTTDTDGLPGGLDGYTELVPDRAYRTFTAKPEAGPYPIESGVKEGVEPGPDPDPEPCAATYLLGADDPRLDLLRQFRDQKMAASRTGNDMIDLYYQRSEEIIDVCERNPLAKWTFRILLESIIPVIDIML